MPSVTLQAGDTLGICSTAPQRLKRGPSISSKTQPGDESQEGVRRITDKYAAPATLLLSPSASTPPSAYSRNPLLPMPSVPAATIPYPSVPVGSTNGLHITAGQSVTERYVSSGADASSAFSDASSDISDASPGLSIAGGPAGVVVQGVGGIIAGGSDGSRSSAGVSVASLGEGVTDLDLNQVEMFYKSQKTSVTVCRCLANLYFGSAIVTMASAPSARLGPSGQAGASPASGSESWEFINTGIPVLVLDSGEHHRERKLTIVLAEKGTGFTLWKDIVTHLTCYTCPHANFHTLRLSADNNKLAGLSFDDGKAAVDFAATIKQLTSDPDDDLLMLSKKGKKKKKKQKESKKPKYLPPRKTDISQPCCFVHVTKLERPQMTFTMPPPPRGFPSTSGGSLNSLTDHFNDKLSLSMRARSQSSDLSRESYGTVQSDH